MFSVVPTTRNSSTTHRSRRTTREKWTVTWCWSCAVAYLPVAVVRSRRILNSLKSGEGRETARRLGRKQLEKLFFSRLRRSFSRASRANFAATPLLRPAQQNRHATQANDVVEKSQPTNNSASGDTRWPAELRASAKFKIRNYRFFWVSEFHKVLQHLNTFI